MKTMAFILRALLAALVPALLFTLALEVRPAIAGTTPIQFPAGLFQTATH